MGPGDIKRWPVQPVTPGAAVCPDIKSMALRPRQMRLCSEPGHQKHGALAATNAALQPART